MTTSQNSPLERVTVNLIPRTSKALADGTALTEISKTDFINRAIQAWAYFEDLAGKGGAVFVREPGSDELSRIRFM